MAWSRASGFAGARARRVDGWLLVLAPAALRLLLIGSFELSEDEAYYWEWSRRLDWAYHDQGPGVALAIRLGTTVFGNTVFGVRCMAVGLMGGALFFAWRLLDRLYGRAAAAFGALLLNVVPLFALGAVMMLHETVQAFFFSLGLYAAWRAAGDGKPGAPGTAAWWALTGLCLGFGFDGKYSMALFAPALAAFLLLDASARAWLRRWELGLALALAALAASPVALWNARHGFGSARQVVALALRGGAGAGGLAELVGTQLLVVSPLLYGLLLWRLGVHWRLGLRASDRRAGFLWLFAVAYAGPFYALAPFSKVYANWPGLAYLPGLMLLAAWAGPHLQERAFRRSPAGRTLLAGTGLAAAVTALLYLHLAAGILPLPGPLDPAKRFTGWPEMGRWAQSLAAEYEARGEPVHYYARSYQIAALLAFYVPGQPVVYEVKRASRANQYDYWEDLPAGADALLVVHRGQAVPEITRRSFEQVSPLPDGTLEIRRHGGVAQRFQAYHCRGYRPG